MRTSAFIFGAVRAVRCKAWLSGLFPIAVWRDSRFYHTPIHKDDESHLGNRSIDYPRWVEPIEMNHVYPFVTTTQLVQGYRVSIPPRGFRDQLFELGTS